jgi:ABC-type multidrug transport system ATPase subunit
MGASASGKSVLMKSIAGRMQQLAVTGEICVDGMKIDPQDRGNDITYVPQDDFLMGEITPRETLHNILHMKKICSDETKQKEVDKLIHEFGLQHVADNAIGTVFVRGLSGGQRKRVEICSEMIQPSSILLLDEPTSGLDGAIAYDVLSSIKQRLQDSQGKLSILMSIHQPNNRILSLFDHLLLMSEGGMIFFGTLPEAIQYFTDLGFPSPLGYTPTDLFLQVSDVNFRETEELDFEGSFLISPYALKLALFLDDIRKQSFYQSLNNNNNNNKDDVENQNGITTTTTTTTTYRAVQVLPNNELNDKEEEEAYGEISMKLSKLNSEKTFWEQFNFFFRQVRILLQRDFTLAKRDPSLYYLQFVLVSTFGFLVGAAFFNVPIEIGSRMNNIPGGLLWLVMMMSYMQVFKVYHLNQANLRFEHEYANNTYYIFAYWLAELIATSILLVTFIPATAIAYFMMGFPRAGYPFLIFLYWLVRNALFILFF